MYTECLLNSFQTPVPSALQLRQCSLALNFNVNNDACVRAFPLYNQLQQECHGWLTDHQTPFGPNITRCERANLC